MNKKLRQHYQQLQVLIYGLQQEEWPLKEITREEAKKIVAKFALSLEPKPFELDDPQFLPALAVKINQFLTVISNQVPPDLTLELVDLEKKFIQAQKKQAEENRKILFPKPDQQTEAAYQKLRETIRNYLREALL